MFYSKNGMEWCGNCVCFEASTVLDNVFGCVLYLPSVMVEEVKVS